MYHHHFAYHKHLCQWKWICFQNLRHM